MSNVTNGAPPRALPQPPLPLAIPGEANQPRLSILEVDPKIVHTPAGNRIPTVETTTDLLASMSTIGQVVPGIIYPHREKSGEWLAAAGNRRAFVCGLLGIPFKALPVDGPVSEADVIRLRLTENVIRKAMHPLEIADDVSAFQRLAGCSQAQAAAQLGLDEATISKAMGISKRLCPDLRPLVENFSLAPSVAYQISRLPELEVQKDIAAKYLAGHLKRDSVEAVVSSRLHGRKKVKDKPVKGTLPGLTMILNVCDVARARSLIAQFDAALVKIEKHGLPISSLPQLLKGT